MVRIDNEDTVIEISIEDLKHLPTLDYEGSISFEDRNMTGWPLYIMVVDPSKGNIVFQFMATFMGGAQYMNGITALILHIR